MLPEVRESDGVDSPLYKNASQVMSSIEEYLENPFSVRENDDGVR